MKPVSNPFPGLRSFEPHESSLFFGRDEQCDDLLSRLSKRRIVAVVGTSGTGKSSLVRAGLLPALHRGYLPSAGSSWQVAVFRPGGRPLANLTECLAQNRGTSGDGARLPAEEIRKHLDASSLGLVAAAGRLLDGQSSSLLVVADQFEEIFRFRDLAPSSASDEETVECVNLLIEAARQDDVPVYVVITMRSDYLGDCARFAGLPEALNDSQFLIPRMSREQLRFAIEGPVAVGGARISARLVQRLLYDVDMMAGRSGRDRNGGPGWDHDQLPVLQHALMRVWEVSKTDRERGEAIDLQHYEQRPVETIHHALDNHAEEVFLSLPSDAHRDVARRLFQRLTDRDAENREVRRPTPMSELEGIMPASTPKGAVADVIAQFGAEGRAFVSVNAQQHVDISHESFIRKWTRLRKWVKEENVSRRVYVKLADTAASWEQKAASLYRGPELKEASDWADREAPTEAWATRYDPRFKEARRFLARSLRQQRIRWSMLAAGVALSVIVAIAMTWLWRRATRAEDQALTVRREAEVATGQLQASNRLLEQSLAAAREGNVGAAAQYQAAAADLEKQAEGRQVLTSGELAELERLRNAEGQWQKDRAAAAARATTLQQRAEELSKRLAELNASASTSGQASAEIVRERENLRKELGGAQGERDQARGEATSLRDQLTDAQSELKQSRTDTATLRQQLNAALAATKGGPIPPAASEGPALVSGDYRDLYRRAINLKDRKEWREAVALFASAANLRGDTGETLTISGFTQPYIPNYYLGVAYMNLNECGNAREAWRRSEAAGAIKSLKEEFATLQKGRASCAGK